MKMRLLVFLSALPFMLLGMTAGLRAQQPETGRRLHDVSSSSCGMGFEPTTSLRTSRRTTSRLRDPASCSRTTMPSIRPSR